MVLYCSLWPGCRVAHHNAMQWPDWESCKVTKIRVTHWWRVDQMKITLKWLLTWNSSSGDGLLLKMSGPAFSLQTLDSLLHQPENQKSLAMFLGSLGGDLFGRCLALVAAYLALLVVRAIFVRIKRHNTFKRMQIPGPKPHLIHGHLYETRREPYVKYADRMHEKYGKTVGIYLGGDPYLLTKDLDLIQQVFVAKSRLFYDRMDFYLNIDPVPDNLICQRGDRWRYMRKLLTPAFTNNKIKTSQFYLDTQQTACKFMAQLDEYSTGEQVTFVDDVYDRMAAVALDVIVKTAFHMDNMISFDGPLDGSSATTKTDSDQNSFDRNAFLNTVKRACRLGFNPLVELIFCFPFLDKPLTYLCNQVYFGSIIQLLFDRLDYLVRRDSSRNKSTASGTPVKQTDTDHQHRRRIIDSLIEVLRERKITKSEFTGNAFVIVFAGFETTANALTFTLWLLARHQSVQQKLRKILETRMDELRSKDDPQNANNQLDVELAELALGCDYLEMVINESLRLYPPVPGLSCRQASEDINLSNGLFVEQGVNIIPSVFSIHRDKEIWGEFADEFRPERFEVLDATQVNSAMFMPFGLGPRNCIGKALAMHELKIFIGRLVLEYSIEFWDAKTPESLKLCSPINITITNSDKIGLKFVKLHDYV